MLYLLFMLFVVLVLFCAISGTAEAILYLILFFGFVYLFGWLQDRSKEKKQQEEKENEFYLLCVDRNNKTTIYKDTTIKDKENALNYALNLFDIDNNIIKIHICKGSKKLETLNR